MPTIAEFIAEHGLTLTATPALSNPHMKGGADMDHWTVTIQNPNARASMSLVFSQGKGHRRWKRNPQGYAGDWTEHDRKRFNYAKGGPVPYSLMSMRTLWALQIVEVLTEPTPPDLASVLDCLASDASGYDNARNFADWCSDYGYDEDSRKAERTYNAIGAQAKELRHMLGNAAYDALLFNCDRL